MKKQRDDPGNISVSIDPHRLDEEWRGQSEKMKLAGDLLAEARDRMDRMEDRLDVAKAEVEIDIRKRPKDYGVEKITEGIVKALITVDERVREATAVYLKAKKAVGYLISLVKSTEHRKEALENLVKLFLAGYFGDPKAPLGATRQDAMQIMARELFKPLTEKKRKHREQA